MSAGIFHTCGIATGGVAYCWGLNEVGELGNNSTQDSMTPVAVAGGLRFSSLSAAGWFFLDEPVDVLADHTCGITIDQVAYCWGSNDAGQLGNGMRGTNSAVPVKVAGQQ
jgi:alpha-tubulin suppressor-like RCC1 family protein